MLRQSFTLTAKASIILMKVTIIHYFFKTWVRYESNRWPYAQYKSINRDVAKSRVVNNLP